MDVVTLVERMTELGGPVQLLPAGDCWRYTGAADSALDLNRFLLSDLVADSAEVELPGTLLHRAVQIHPTATLERSTIRPRATICGDFRLRRALRLHVGEGATISLT